MEKKLVGSRCAECDRVYYPKRNRCLTCEGDQFKDIEISGEGTLITYTELIAIPRGVEQLPLKLGIVEFENGFRILGQIKADNLKIGMKLRTIRVKLREIGGESQYGVGFKSA